MREITVNMSVDPATILEGAEMTYPKALEQTQAQGVPAEDLPEVMYAIGFCRASELMHQSLCEGLEQLLTDLKECLENDEDFTIDYSNRRHIFTEDNNGNPNFS